jgi:hypothetical protein
MGVTEDRAVSNTRLDPEQPSETDFNLESYKESNISASAE